MSYQCAWDHLEDHFEMVSLMLQRHGRKYPNRLIGDELFANDSIGRAEIRQSLKLEVDSSGERWLDELGYLKLSEIREKLGMCARRMDSRLQETGAQERPPTLPLEELRASFRLSDLELRLLIAASAPRLSQELARAFPFAWADFSVRQPTASFLAELVGEDSTQVREALECLDSRGTLARYRLVILHEHERWKPLTPLLHSPIGVSQRVLDFIKGKDLDRASLGGCVLYEAGEDFGALVLEEEVREGLVSAMRAASPRLCLNGPKGSGRRTVLQALADEGGQRLLEVDLCMALMPSESVEN